MGIIESAADMVAGPWVWPLKILGGLKSAGSWLLNNPVIGLSLLLAVVGWFAYHEHALYAQERAARALDHKTYAAAQATALAKANAQKTTAETVSAQFAGVTNHDYEDGIADGKSQLAAYVARRLQSAAQSSAPSVPAATQDRVAPVSGQSAPSPAVAFTQQQLTGWDADYQYGQTCYKWAQGVSAMFDGKHWPTPAETATATPAN